MSDIPLHPQFVNLTGQKFGKLTVLEYSGDHVTPSGQRKRLWRCRCDCGGEITAHGSSLKSGNTVSCWCVRRESASKISVRKHGDCSDGKMTVEYRTWQAMLSRIKNPRNCNFKHYGARGIKVCERWHDFALFLDDMGRRPVGGSIERINNDGNYEPVNCRWATNVEQNNNTRGNRHLDHLGKRMTVAEWSFQTGISHGTIMQRLRMGWSAEKTLSQPVRSKSR